MNNESFPELNEHDEIKKLANANPQQAIVRGMLNLSVTIMNARSSISSSVNWVKNSISDFDKTFKASNSSSERLATAIIRATWIGVGITAATLAWDIYKTIYLGK